MGPLEMKKNFWFWKGTFTARWFHVANSLKSSCNIHSQSTKFFPGCQSYTGTNPPGLPSFFPFQGDQPDKYEKILEYDLEERLHGNVESPLFFRYFN